MEELIRRLIREKRAKAEHHATPSEAFRRYFGPEHGVELPEPGRYGVVTRGVAGPAAAGSLRPGMPGGIQAAGAGDPEVMLEDIPRHGPGLAGLIGGVDELGVDRRYVFAFGHHQPGQILGKVPALRGVGEDAAELGHRFFNHRGKSNDTRHEQPLSWPGETKAGDAFVLSKIPSSIEHGTVVEPFDVSGPLFQGADIAAALASHSEDGVFESLLLRGFIDE